MGHAKSIGMLVGLHTGGCDPDALATLLPLCDWVGLDIKAPWGMYQRTTGDPASGYAARDSLRLLLESGTPHESRTTWHPSLLAADDIAETARQLHAEGERTWAIQACRSAGTTHALPDIVPTADDVPQAAWDLFPNLTFRPA